MKSKKETNKISLAPNFLTQGLDDLGEKSKNSTTSPDLGKSSANEGPRRKPAAEKKPSGNSLDFDNKPSKFGFIIKNGGGKLPTSNSKKSETNKKEPVLETLDFKDSSSGNDDKLYKRKVDNFDISKVDPKDIIKMSELRAMNLRSLIDLAKEYEIDQVNRMLKQDIICMICKQAVTKGKTVHGDGVVEIIGDGFAFLRSIENSYVPSSDNIYLSQNQIRRFNLKVGDYVSGYIKEPRRSERYFSMFKVDKINNHPVDKIDSMESKINFDNLIPIYPKEKFNLDINIGDKSDPSTRIIDIISPIGKGQRALIVAPPRTGKTVLLQNIALAINKNHPELDLVMLLIDERPEEVTDMRRCVKGEIISSTFDESAERHVALAEIAIARVKRLVEEGRDVVILLDSITRLARAYNAVAPSSGKVLSGGVDSNALQKPKRFFGAARNTVDGGSLTIIATALVETGSRMDEVIFEEFKGRGNCEIVLDRKIAEKRLFPAIDILRSGTRREEEMIDPDTFSKMSIIRRISTHMNDHISNSSESIAFLIKEISKSPDNQDFFKRMNSNF